MDLTELQLVYKFVLSILLGALIGAEREKSHLLHKGTDFAGIRTFMLITFCGSLAAYLGKIYYTWIIAVIFVCFVVVVLAGYVLSSYFNKDVGMTTELSTLIAFIIGVLVFITSEEVPILMTIVLTLILSFKSTLHQFVYNLRSNDFFDTIKFIVIAFVILPLLKHVDAFGPYNAINLYEIWLMVVFVSAISFIGYILINIFGSKRGTFITGVLGGILSSTAAVTSLANKSKEEKNDTSSYVAAAAIACATMFLRVLVVVTILNKEYLSVLVLPMVILAVIGYAGAMLFWKKGEGTNAEMSIKSPLMLSPAIKFGLFYGFVTILANITKIFLGAKGILVAALVSGFADVDAITIFIARHNDIAIMTGVAGIILAGIVNTLVKAIIAKSFGEHNFGANVLKVLAPVIAVGLLMVFFL